MINNAKFNAAIDTLFNVKFEWGVRDCLFGLVVPIAEAVTDRRNLFRSLRGKYRTARGAIGTMKRNNFANLADLVASEFPEIHPSQMVTGDIVAIPTDDDFAYSLGICNGQRVYVLHKNGLGTRDASEVTRAFRMI